MVRLAFRGALGVLWAALAAACLGGQTGQPSRGTSCESTQLSTSDRWSNTTVEAAATAFAGTYESPLVWLSATSNTPVDLPDSLQLTIAYPGAGATRDCTDRVSVPVSVTLTTSESGIAESGDATLELSGSSGALVGNLKYESDRVALDAMLTEVPRGVALSGDLDSRDENLPGSSASFAVEP